MKYFIILYFATLCSFSSTLTYSVDDITLDTKTIGKGSILPNICKSDIGQQSHYSEIATVSMKENRLDVFIKGADNAVYHKWCNGSKWSEGWKSLGGQLPSNAKIAVVSAKENRINLFVKGTDNTVYHKWWNGNKWSNNWENLGGQLHSNSKISVVSTKENRINLFVKGIDNAVYHKWWNGNSWSSNWENLGGDLPIDAQISVTSMKENHISVFAKGKDNAVYHKSWNNKWSANWENLGGQLPYNSQISAISMKEGFINIFVRATDNTVYHKSWHSGRWSNWEGLGGQLPADTQVSAVSMKEGLINIFVIGLDDAVYHKWWNGIKWNNNWQSLGGKLSPKTQISAISIKSNRINLFVTGIDNAIYDNFWNGNRWNDKWYNHGGVNSNNSKIKGYIDMHTHPMTHLAFGGKLLHGAPDADILIPAIPDGNGCRHYERAKNINEALSHCNATHGGVGLFDNTCGDDLRKKILRGTEEKLQVAISHHEEGAKGYPILNKWPAHNNITHQQMYVDWIKESFDNGLKAIVALTVNNATFSAAFSGPGDRNLDDVSSSNIQIQELKRMVDRHRWMEIALDHAQMKKIISSGKMAVIIGIEVDNIGNFINDLSISEINPSLEAKNKINDELDRLYRNGVRYIFPVHVTDNKFGGTAIYENFFNLSNYHINNKFWDIECAKNTDIGHKFEVQGFDFPLAIAKAKIGIDILRKPQNPPSCNYGHVNSKGMTPLGAHTIKEMMKKGFMIDIDHMSEKMVNSVLHFASIYNYPINSGHNGLRVGSSSERHLTSDQYKKIADLGGMAAIGSAKSNPEDFLDNYKKVANLMGYKNLAIGTDVNGFEPLPGPPKEMNNEIDNSTYTFGNKTWDFNTDGVANYAMLPMFIRSVQKAGMSETEKNTFFNSASHFANMWEKCEVRSSVGLTPIPKCSKIKNRYSKTYVDIKNNKLNLNNNFNTILEEGWTLERVKGTTDYFRIKSKKNKYYLHVENEKIDFIKNVNKNWHSAMWKIEVPQNQNATNYVRLKSRYKDYYLHTEYGKLDIIKNVNKNWHSAMWLIENCEELIIN